MALRLAGGQLGRELPRPQWTVGLLWALAILTWLAAAAVVVVLAMTVPPETPPMFWAFVGAGVVGAALLGAMALGMAMVVKYAFSAAVSAKLTERGVRQGVRKTEVAQPASGFVGVFVLDAAPATRRSSVFCRRLPRTRS